MEHRHLGRSRLRVSRLTLGAMAFGGLEQVRVVGQTDLEGARRRVVPSVLDQGLGPPNTIDVLVEVAQRQRVSPARVASGWLIARPGITTVSVGRRTHEQLSAESGVR